MSAKYDAELCARLAREARSPLLRMTASELECFVSDKLPAMADQLDAARAEVARLYTLAIEQGERAFLAERELQGISAIRSAIFDGSSPSVDGSSLVEFVKWLDDNLVLSRENEVRLTAERDELRRTVETLQGQVEAVAPVVDLVEAFVETVNAATRHFANRGKGGQHVSFHGDFAGATPSTMSRLEWWARAFASKLGKEEGEEP